MPLREFKESTLEKAVELIRERERSYGACLLTMALLPVGESFSPLAGRCVFTRGTPRPGSYAYDYTDLLLARRVLSPKQGLAFVESLKPDSTFTVLDLPRITLSDRYFWEDRRSRLPSGGFDYALCRPEWPTDLLEFRERQEPPSPEVRQPLSRPGLPLYPNLGSAVIHFVFDRPDVLGRDRDFRRFQVVLPDYRGRICSVELGHRLVKVRVQRLSRSSRPLLLKLYCRGEDSVWQQEKRPIKGRADFEVGSAPEYILVQLLDDSGQCLDEREADLHLGRFPEDFTVTPSERAIAVRQMIQGGEGPNIEFKREIGKEVGRRELIETVSAFANSTGGTILLGVDRNGRIVGCYLDLQQLVDTLTDLIRSSCDPPVDFHTEHVMVGRKPLILIHIAEGSQKPHLVRDRGPFVRAGATDRIASRRELDAIYARRGIQ